MRSLRASSLALSFLLAPALVLVPGCGSNDSSTGGSSGGQSSGGAAGSGGASAGSGGASTGGSAGASSGGSGGSAGTAGASGAGAVGGGGTSAFVPAYPGQPKAGQLVWGAAVSGNGDPETRHEIPAGHIITVHRTFFQWTQRTGAMINMAQGDLAKHRLPWVSTKTPSWAEMAAGQHDAEIDEMLQALDALGGPVWLTMHHEPEGGGGTNAPDDPAGPTGHVGMNQRVRERMTALGIDHVALAPILMSWTWDPASKRNPEDWWKPGIYDFLGVDHYRDAEAPLLTSTWASVRTWAAGKQVDVAVGEWGMRGSDTAAGQRVHEWYDHAALSNADGKGARVVGLSAFDSGLNSPTGSWELTGEQLAAFWQLLGDPRTATVVP